MLPPDAYEAILKMVFVLMAGCVLCMSKIKAETIDYSKIQTFQEIQISQ
ncbi:MULTISPECIES: hypothetical protein [Halobacteriovorax]|nr:MULTISPECIES: hypothetical protein [Halobacteriovorax]